MRRFAGLAVVVLALAGCGGKGDGDRATEAAATWPANWCSAKLGMTREEVRRVMGDPTDEVSLDDWLSYPEAGLPQLDWESAEAGFFFAAFFNRVDRAWQFKIYHPYTLAGSERGQLPCGTKDRVRRGGPHALGSAP